MAAEPALLQSLPFDDVERERKIYSCFFRALGRLRFYEQRNRCNESLSFISGTSKPDFD